VFGGDTSAVLDNVNNTISGAGQLGGGALTLHNEGVIDASGTNAMVIDTGTNAVVNSGILRASGSGGLVVESAVTGDPLTGPGRAEIGNGSRLEFGAASDARVSFDNGAAGTLTLDRSAEFTGTVAGFDGYDAIDLADIVGGQTALYAANADNSGGTLIVRDSAENVLTSLALLGQYAAGTGFTTAADSSGGTVVTLQHPEQQHLVPNPIV